MIAYCLLAFVVALAPAPARDVPTLQIQAVIKAEMARQGIPGLSAAIALDREVQWAEGFGKADLENSVPAKRSTVYRLASVSKPITAVAVMQLVEQDKIQLDAPVQEYIPAFPEKAWPLTTRHLLGHLGGIRHYRTREEVNSTKRYVSLTEALEIFKDDPLLFEPGARYSYSTYGYNLLGCVVEGASGERFPDYLRERIFRPAGMESIRVDDVAEIIPHRAQGYLRVPDGPLLNSNLADTSNKIPGGGLCGTVVDLARFAIALQQGTLLKKSSIDLMFTRQRLAGGDLTEYGLGWFLQQANGPLEVFHSGGQQRVSTFLYLLPSERLSVALMCNLERADLFRLARQIAGIVLNSPASWDPLR
jgi:CubicO group peptidase (beta-lactamase class C family)